MSEAEKTRLDSFLHDWHRPTDIGGARESQKMPDGDWFIWLIQAGRGYGKTRTGAETIRRKLDTKEWRVVNVAGPTWMDVMDTMVHGVDDAPGLMKIWPEHQKPSLHLGDRPYMLTHNGGMVRLRSADNPERFRGPQAEGGWVDEIDAWKPKSMPVEEAFALFEMGIRLGNDPRIIATSTPKRGRLIASLKQRDDVITTRGSMSENKANLAPQFIRAVTNRYGGTQLGRQELEGELLELVEGAIVDMETLKATRRPLPSIDQMKKIVVAIDPSGAGDTEKGDEKGVIVAGVDEFGHGYMLRDVSTMRGPEGWGEIAVNAYYAWGADAIIGERNYGGDMVASVVRSAAKAIGVSEPIIRLVTASRGKHVRFSPVGAMHNRGRLHICEEDPRLEAEITAFTEEAYEGDGSPNRADAWVWAIHDLCLQHEASLQIF